MSVVIRLSGGVQLELKLTDNASISTSAVSLKKLLPLDDKLRDGIQIILDRFGSGSLQWIAWRTSEQKEKNAFLILTLYTETEQLCLQVEELCRSGEAKKRLEGLFRGFGYQTDFSLTSERVNDSCATNLVYSFLPLQAPLHSVGNGNSVLSETEKDSTMALSGSGPPLLDNLKTYESSKVNPPNGEDVWAKDLMKKYIVEGILKYIRENSPYVVTGHYTGSSYEGLKTQHADEFDIMIQLKNSDVNYRHVEEVPGYALIVQKEGSEDAFYHKLLQDGNVSPMKFRSEYFYGLVQKGVNHIMGQDNQNELAVSSHGPAVQVDIIPGPSEKFNFKISVDLVLSYMFEDGSHFVAKPFKEYADSKDVKKDLPCKAELLWRQSFSSKEKKYLKKMDSHDQGCRHRCVRIIKTFFSNDTTLKKLTSYHIKTAFLHYNQDQSLTWKDGDLGDRFLGILGFMLEKIRNREMPHYYVENLNLLDGFKDITLINIQGNLEKRIKKLKDPQQQGKIFAQLLE